MPTITRQESDAELKKTLGKDTLANGNLLVNWVRIIKSEAEIALMSQAGKIAEKVMATALDNLVPGKRECDAVAAVLKAQASGTPDFGGDYPAIVPMMPTGEKTSAPHLTWTDDPYQANQAVNLELAGCRHRYHCPHRPHRISWDPIRRRSCPTWPTSPWTD